MGVVKESVPEVMTYKGEMAVKYIKKGLGRAWQIEENAQAVVGREHSTFGEHQKVPFCWNIEHLKERRGWQSQIIKSMMCAAKGSGLQLACLCRWRCHFLR